MTAYIENAGYLPTHVTQQAVEKQAAQPVTVTLAVERGSIELNDATQTLGHLAGRSERQTTYSPWSDEWGSPRKRAQWLIRGDDATTLTLIAGTLRAGTAQVTVALDDAS